MIFLFNEYVILNILNSLYHHFHHLPQLLHIHPLSIPSVSISLGVAVNSHRN